MLCEAYVCAEAMYASIEEVKNSTLLWRHDARDAHALTKPLGGLNHICGQGEKGTDKHPKGAGSGSGGGGGGCCKLS